MGNFTWGNKAKHCWVISTNFLFSKVGWQCAAFTPQTNFPAHNLNFHWRWRNRNQATFKNIFYFRNIVSTGEKIGKTHQFAGRYREDKSMCRLLKCSKNQPQSFQMTSIGKSVIVHNVINDFWSALGTMRLCTSGGGGLTLPPSSSESGSRSAGPHCSYLDIYISQKKSGFVRMILKTNFNSTCKPNTSLFWAGNSNSLCSFFFYFFRIRPIHCCLHTVAAIPKSWHIWLFASNCNSNMSTLWNSSNSV